MPKLGTKTFRGYSIEREDINPHTHAIRLLPNIIRPDNCLIITDSHDLIVVLVIKFVMQWIKMGANLDTTTAKIKQFLIIRPWHADIHIIVPRDETMVANGP